MMFNLGTFCPSQINTQNNPSQPSLGVTGRAVLDIYSHAINIYQGGLLGGLVGKNPPANMEDMGLILGPEISQMLQSN